ncbi:serine/threonine-protein phosphatase [Verrucomicrobiaceae bacterium N1E253]|uniref:Serine/threonine-protein phosphatase n=1 Tax=Oceaniferula marina TaxID=2748318 RepID=A0A851GFL7_9BACT|nr:PP2C family serine/threonine-protein phosphatase [Oceaniferula marina]NWK54075.1 serine/threonine-protein phosphatase [Oceaniferula marina]
MHSIHIAIASSIGGREEQQDAAHSWTSEHTCLLVLADGVGGNIGGAAAAKTVIETADEIWNHQHGRFSSPRQSLENIAELAHQRIAALTPGERRNPASTIVALYLDEHEAHWIHCGDSRLYRIQNGQTATRTRDHSVVQLLVEQGKITEEELNSHPDKGRILKSLGGGSFKGSDYQSCTYQPGDQFLLCSDGYWESVPAKAPILPSRPRDRKLEDHINRLVTKAVKQNGPDGDNTTIAIAEVAAPNKSHQAPAHPQSSPLRSVIKSTLLIIFYTFIVIDIIILFYIFLSQ